MIKLPDIINDNFFDAFIGTTAPDEFNGIVIPTKRNSFNISC